MAAPLCVVVKKGVELPLRVMREVEDTVDEVEAPARDGVVVEVTSAVVDAPRDADGDADSLRLGAAERVCDGEAELVNVTSREDNEVPVAAGLIVAEPQLTGDCELVAVACDDAAEVSDTERGAVAVNEAVIVTDAEMAAVAERGPVKVAL